MVQQVRARCTECQGEGNVYSVEIVVQLLRQGKGGSESKLQETRHCQVEILGNVSECWKLPPVEPCLSGKGVKRLFGNCSQ